MKSRLSDAAHTAAGDVTLIMAAGNRDRGDDAAGPLVLDRLPRPLPPGVTAVELDDDPLASLELISASKRVLAVDATRSGAEPGTIWQIQGPAGLEQTAGLAAGTHQLGIRELLALAFALGSFPPDVTIYAIEGKDFSLGQSPSPEVARSIADVAAAIAREIGIDLR